MAMNIGTGVRLYGYNMEDWIFTFHAAADIITLHEEAGKTAVGRMVQIDFATKAGQVKLAADDAQVFGRIEAVENRKQEGIQVVAVALKFLQKVSKKAGAAINAGTSVVGAGSGEVKTATLDLTNNVVPETAASAATEVIVIKM